MNDHTLFFRPNGEIQGLYQEDLDLTPLGSLSIARASTVEPDKNNRWHITFPDGTKLGPFDKRSVALFVEKNWINNHLRANQ